MNLKVAKEFSRTPGPRARDEGDFSGQQFREECLIPKINAAKQLGEQLIIELDGTAGYGTSFLEEAFGGLIRDKLLTLEEADKLLHFLSKEEDYLPGDIREYMRDAAQR